MLKIASALIALICLSACATVKPICQTAKAQIVQDDDGEILVAFTIEAFKEFVLRTQQKARGECVSAPAESEGAGTI